jgi:hypothetical protein
MNLDKIKLNHLRSIPVFLLVFFAIIGTSVAQSFTPLKAYYQNLEGLLVQNKNEFGAVLKPVEFTNGGDQAHVNEASYYQLDARELDHILVSRPKFFTQDMVIDGTTVKLGLEEVSVFAPNHVFVTNTGDIIEIDRSQVATYRGYIVGNVASWATLTIADGKATYMIANNKGNYEIHPQTDQTYVGYYSKNLVNPPTGLDNTEDMPYKPLRLDMSGGERTGNCVQIYIQTDFSVFQALGSGVAGWISAQMNNVTAVYAISDVQLYAAPVTTIWTSADPYQSITNIGGVRDAFINQVGGSQAGKIAHLLSLRNLGGGIANGIGGMCAVWNQTPGPQCVSTNLSSSTTAFPSYSYNTYLISHEIGHVMGMRHTHACVWNNNLTQIDDCGNVVAANAGNTPEGLSCFVPSAPIIPPTGGTIMSNCDQLPSSSINLNLGFGAIVGAELRQNYIFAPCNTGNCAGIAPTNDQCQDGVILPLTRDCTQYGFNLTGATTSFPIPPAFQCGTPTGSLLDVWFKVKPLSTSTPSGTLIIETFQAAGGPTDLLIQAYKGSSCTSLTQVTGGCHDNKTALDKHVKLVLTGLTNLDTVYFRVISKTALLNGAFNICAYEPTLPCHPDAGALLDFYLSNGGSSWINKSGWQSGTTAGNCNVCTWYGVTCNSQNRVTSISLPNNNVTGTGLPPSIANLTFLNTLKLNGNMIMGALPTTAITGLTNLRTLDLGANKFTGSIPGSYGALPSLRNLYLDNNLLTGTLPSGLTANNLNLIYVQNNNLSGCYPVSYNEYCSKSYNFTGNPLLANGVSFVDFCASNLGIDSDADTYCSGGLDCNDMNFNIKPGATELCDSIDNDCNALIDDVAGAQTKTWVGGNGSWNVSVNWSPAGIPLRCDNVLIGGAAAIVTVPANYRAVARSITVQSGRTLTVAANGQLEIAHGLNVVNSGTINNLGKIEIDNILNSTLFGLANGGTFTNGPTGVVNILNSGARSLHNTVGGTITNNGIMIIDGNAFDQPSNGIYNEGTFNNFKEITIRNLTGTEMVLKPSSGFVNHPGGILRVRKI